MGEGIIPDIRQSLAEVYDQQITFVKKNKPAETGVLVSITTDGNPISKKKGQLVIKKISDELAKSDLMVKDVVIDKPFPQSEITDKEAKIVLVITTNGKKIDIEHATEKGEDLLEAVNINAIVEKIKEDINL